MKRIFMVVAMMLTLVSSVFAQHGRWRTHRPTKPAAVVHGRQHAPLKLPNAVPQPEAASDRFDVIEVDGQMHIIRSTEGRYGSFNELPITVRNEPTRLTKLLSAGNSDGTGPSKTMAVFVVSDAGDAADNNLNDGVYSPATLRSAIQNANKLGGAQTISFAPGITVIQPLSSLPGVTAALTIDGTVTSGKVILDGSATTAQIGLSLSGTSTVTNMVFKSWSLVGLAFTAGAVNSVVRKNEFTLNTIGLNINANGTTVGSDDDADRNYAYGNKQDGIDITNANHTSIVNNFCGTHDGTTASPNKFDGLYVLGNDNEVRKNVLSGNQMNGLEIGQFSNRTLVEDNFIGVDINGNSRLANTSNGINTFGSGDTILVNVISGNGYGITVLGQASHTYIAGNFIGPNKKSDSLIGNSYGGLQILGSSVIIDGNTISGNTNSGILLTGWGGTVVKNNFIGTDPAGMLKWGNSGDGINIGSNKNIIGSQSFLDANVISGNGGSGIYMYGGTTFQLGGPSLPNYVRGNVIQKNIIGTDNAQTKKIPNQYGIAMQGYTDSNFVQQNVISGNQNQGVWLSGIPTRNVLAENFIGTDDSGSDTLGNEQEGVLITQSASSNVVMKNVIADNGSSGITIQSVTGKIPSGNVIIGNTIGLDKNKMEAMPNYGHGVLIWQARNTRIGGLGPDSGNVISGNIGGGVTIYGDTASGNMIRNNLIGISDAGNVDAHNGVGINIQNSKGNIIGGTEPGSGNSISGNLDDGLDLFAADSNIVLRNIIGLEPTGTTKKGNGAKGIAIHDAHGNSIGDSLDADGNVISGNDEDGIEISGGTNNKITHNFIGTDRTKTLVLENDDNGVLVTGASQGTPSVGNTISANTIAHNGILGINLGSTDSVAVNDTLDADAGDNGLQNYPNLLVAVSGPQLSISGFLLGIPSANFHLEFFSNDSADRSDHTEGLNYIGAYDIITNSVGVAAFHVLIPVVVTSGMSLTATATDGAGSTSEFSNAIRVQPSGVYADIGVSVTSNARSVRRADTLVYHLTILNNGPDSATQVITRDTISNHVTFIADTISQGSASFSNGMLTFSIGTLATGKSASVTLIVKVDSGSSLVSKAYASAHETDPNLNNNVGVDTTFILTATGVNDRTNSLPLTFALKQNYPNPFNPSTMIAFDLPSAGHVQLRVFDLLGREVASLLDEQRNAGRYHVEWNASQFSSGVYFYQIQAGSFTATKKLILLK